MQLIDGYVVFSDAWFVELRLVLLGGVLLGAAFCDIRQRRIPNLLVASGLCTAFIYHLLFPIEVGLLRAFYGMALGFAMLLPFYLLRGMAAGDVKLMAMVGAFLGPLATFFAVVATFLVGGLWAAAVITRRHAWSGLVTNMHHLSARARDPDLPVGTGATSLGRIPYAVAIAAGTAAALLAGKVFMWG